MTLHIRKDTYNEALLWKHRNDRNDAHAGYCAVNRMNLQHWGLRCLFVFVFGLYACCQAAARDGLDKTVQCVIDKSCAPGLFSLTSVPFITGCAGAAVIVIAGVIAIFCKSQDVRRAMFFLMSGGVTLKIAVVEFSRIIMHFGR